MALHADILSLFAAITEFRSFVIGAWFRDYLGVRCRAGGRLGLCMCSFLTAVHVFTCASSARHRQSFPGMLAMAHVKDVVR